VNPAQIAGAADPPAASGYRNQGFIILARSSVSVVK
jgi:hypothetical protein